ncbi:MAG: hypothetical protein EBY22_15705 [Gammaproteobacteria bacterium]|jgi:outer membrane lipoprotein-sorting protein|nr:hypothetical protein [Gammaproteobacteria bacterium]
MLDVGVHGAGRVGKSFADSITIRLPVINYLMPKTIMMGSVAQKKPDLQRRRTVAEDTIRTVINGGRNVA